MGELISIIVLVVVAFAIRPSFVFSSPTLSPLYWRGVLMRIIGTLIYIYYAYKLSGGAVDAFVYDNYAENFAQYFVKGDFSPFTNVELYRGGELFYTNFVAYPAALFLIITFNSTFGIYLLFSVICFGGLILLLKSFVSNYPLLNKRMITMLLLFFPALWFWTSTIGKDAFMFLGIGLICHGISEKRFKYLEIAFGLTVIYVFRPPIAYMVILAMSALFILNPRDAFLLRFAKIVIGIAVLLVVLNYLSVLWGIEEFSEESISDLQAGVLQNNNFGKGALDVKTGGFTSIPQGVVDVLARPFLWEASNFLALASALEINFVLLVLWLKRKSVIRFFKDSLSHRLSTFVLAFVSIYILSVGLFENNIGLIARHRALIFPFLFLIACGYDKTHRSVRKVMKFPKPLVPVQHVKQ